MKIFVLVFTFVFALMFISNAQTVTLFGGVALPQGDFGDDDVDDFMDEDGEAGLAVTGFGAGFEYSAPMQAEGLSWVFGASFLMNGVDEKEIEKDIPDDWKIDIGSYINIPIMAGIKYESQSSPTMKFYGQGMAGINIAMIGDLELSYNEEIYIGDPIYDYVDYDVTQTYSFDTATSFGFGFGGGIILNNINIGLRYLLLGTAKLEGTIKTDIDINYPGATVPEVEDEDIDKDQPISILTLMIGIQL